MSNDETFVNETWLHLRAGYPILSVDTPEEARALTALREAGRRVVRKDDAVPELIARVLKNYPQLAGKAADPDAANVLAAARAHSKECADEVGDVLGLPLITYDTTALERRSIAE